jgi:hypothetical protein
MLVFASHALGQRAPAKEFISLESAQAVLRGLAASLPPELKSAGTLDQATWSAWVQRQDGEIRKRLDRGEEDTLTNLLRFGVTFTKEYRIDDSYLARYGESSLVNAFADTRADDLVRALAQVNAPAGIAEMRRFLEKQGFSFKTTPSRLKVKQYLLRNLKRMRDEFLKYKAQAKDDRRYQLFQGRGISLDSNLWPDYQLDVHLRSMVEKGLLKPGSVRRIAIIGPGLDFANKEAGNDFYPPQTIQPFAVLDSLARLGIAEPAHVEIYTLDISQSVNVHIERAQGRAARGQDYIMQLPWNAERPMSEEYRHSFIEYWQKLGDKIGERVAAIPVPAGAASTRTRAVKVRADIVRRVVPLDINVVYQRLTLSPQNAFDMMIGTNVFVYYGDFEQSLARANVAVMLKPGGYLLSNDKLPDTVPSGLRNVLETPVVSSLQPLVRDVVFCYRRTE